MKALKIDVETEEITEVEVVQGSDGTHLKSMKEYIGCDWFDTVTFKERDACIYVDDMGLQKEAPEGEKKKFFCLITYPNPIGSNGLIMGVGPAGESIDVPYTAQQVRELILFCEDSGDHVVMPTGKELEYRGARCKD